MSNPYYAKYLAYELTRRHSSDSIKKLAASLVGAQVDLNPHQIEAALFAFRSPLSKGAILADEVGLGKTIEAGLVLSQKWAERKRQILLIVPSSLRKQWYLELQEKFFLPSMILEAISFNQTIKEGNLNPFIQNDKIVICSYQFARSKSPYIKQTQWDLVVVDEAHRLRNVYKTNNKIAREIKLAIEDAPKILLTATPLQNSLLELYGLVSIIDDHIFGDIKTFKANYARVSREQDVFESEIGLVEPNQEMFADLRGRLKQVCIRTLRRQVLEYINYTERKPITQDYVPTEQEIELYEGVSEFLQRPKLFALPFSQRQLITLILRKLLASSSFAIASTLDRLVFKLRNILSEAKAKLPIEYKDEAIELSDNFESINDVSEDWIDDEEDDETEVSKDQNEIQKEDVPLIEEELRSVERLRTLAEQIFTNSKGEALLTALKKGFEMTAELGAKKKAIIFTESTITQKYLCESLLAKHGYNNKIVLFNGSNSDEKSKNIYKNWLVRYKDTDRVTGSKTADTRAALVDYFREEAEIMIATEAAAEGVNLQFCSLVINYDLPWNPQRIEQRIGRCHRYGQKHDVVVINFVNRKNAADQRVYELLDQKFNLFKGVFGASDEVLGTIESGVDFEKRIAGIYQSCRTTEEINSAFDKLQHEMDESIQSNLSDTRQKLLENFDAEVHEKLKINLKESKVNLDIFERWLWEMTRYFLDGNAHFSDSEYTFSLKSNPFRELDIDLGPYKIGKNIDNAHIYRLGHPLAQCIIEEIKSRELVEAELIFDYSNTPLKISVIESLVGKSGILRVSNLTVSTFDSEDHVILSALDSQDREIESEIIRRMFSLPVRETCKTTITNQEHEKLKTIEDKFINELSVNISERNSSFFDTEVEKLEHWSDDVKKSLEISLRKLDIDIKTEKTNARKIINLEEKIKIQKQIKELEKKRNEMRRGLFEAQDEVEQKKEQLLDNIESRLKQHSEKNMLFSIRWKVI